MQRILKWLLYAIFIIHPLQAGDPFQYLSSTLFDFGKVKQGESLEGAFLLVNIRDEPVEIIKIRPDCGCTLVRAASGTYAPGDTIFIPFTLRTYNLTGLVRKGISVHLKNRALRARKLVIQAHVFKELDLSRSYMMFRSPVARADTCFQETLYLYNYSGQTIHLLKVSNYLKPIAVFHDGKRVDNQDELKIPLTTGDSLAFQVQMTPNKPIGRRGYIRFETDLGKMTHQRPSVSVIVNVRETK